MTKYSLTRRKILTEAYERCLKEMYEKATPSVDITEYYNKIKSGEITKEDQEKSPIYNRHYLSHEEEKYIVKKYHDAYRLDPEFADNCNLLLSDMEKEVPVDKYIEAHEDEYGYHPGYRGYEDRPPMIERVKTKLQELGMDCTQENAQALTDLFRDFIIERRDFYHFDRDAEKFDCSIWLGPCPTSNKEAVIKYWKSQGKDIEITDRDPEKLWYYDEGWTEEEIEEEFNPRPVNDEEDETPAECDN